MRNTLFVAVALTTFASFTPAASAGRGGSYANIQNAINSGSQDAIIAELERSERLICDACIAPVLDLLNDPRYAVREAASWWFARRPAMKLQLMTQASDDLQSTDSQTVRDAADLVGTFRLPAAIPWLAADVGRTDLSSEARVAIVRALGTIGSAHANDAITAAMADSDADVRLQALDSWISIRYQQGATPAVDLVGDTDARVRAKAAGVCGTLREAGCRAGLEAQLSTDSEPTVRRNAAWALGRIGDQASRAALEAAENDPSPLVRLTAKAALQELH